MAKSDELHKISTILDKLTLDSLTLLEEQLEIKLNIENTMTDGEQYLAKSRYILGQNQVSSLQLPIENGQDFNPTVLVSKDVNDGVLNGEDRYLETVKRDEQIDPVRWFGYLIPQQLNFAQKLYQQTLQLIVQSVNLQMRFVGIVDRIGQLKDYKKRVLVEE